MRQCNITCKAGAVRPCTIPHPLVDRRRKSLPHSGTSLDADPVLGEFFVKYGKQAKSLGVSPEDLYTALLADAEKLPPNWNLQGRQIDVWKSLGEPIYLLFSLLSVELLATN